MKGFLINLDSSEDRLRQVEARLLATGFVRVSDSPVRWRREALVIERIPAVDGRKLSESELLKWRQRERPFWNWTTHELTPGEIGCFLSHREFWQKVVDERLSHAFVLEDDILLADDCFKILSSADWIPPEADFVKLNLFPTNSTHTYPVSKPVGLVEGREIRRTAGRIYGTGCYVITEAAARECLEHSGKLSLPVDLFMFDSRFSFATEKKIYTILPGLAVDVGAASTIEGGRNKDRLNACQHLLKGFYSVARRTKLRLLMRKYALSWVRSEFQS